VDFTTNAMKILHTLCVGQMGARKGSFVKLAMRETNIDIYDMMKKAGVIDLQASIKYRYESLSYCTKNNFKMQILGVKKPVIQIFFFF